MICKKCGNPLANEVTVCPVCGEPVNQVNVAVPQENVVNAQNNNVNMPNQAPIQPTNPVVGGEQAPIPTVNPSMTVNTQAPEVNTPNNNVNMPNQAPIQPTNPVPTATPVANAQAQAVNVNQNTPNAGVNQMGMPAGGQYYNNQPNVAPTEKKKSSPLIVVILLLAVLVMVVALFANKIFGGSKNEPASGSGNESTNQTPSGNLSTYEYNDFKLSIPTGYEVVSSEDNSLILINKSKKLGIVTYFMPEYMIYNIKNDFDNIKDKLTQNGLTINTTMQNAYNELDWVIFDSLGEVNEERIHIIVGFAGVGDYHVAVNTLFNFDNNSLDEVYPALSAMFKTAEYIGTEEFSVNANSVVEELTIPNTFDKTLFS